MTSSSATQDSYPYQNEPIWSRSEKTIARTPSTLPWDESFTR
ncbi:MAG TPA: hypothetical protein VN901_09545 [Candidatus Acidoferrales bacterium]|nr:hypothetical protein [Candidatus Acidoferrales bacterium]